MNDLQHHWIRECQDPPIANIRRTAESSVLEILIELECPPPIEIK